MSKFRLLFISFLIVLMLIDVWLLVRSIKPQLRIVDSNGKVLSGRIVAECNDDRTSCELKNINDIDAAELVDTNTSSSDAGAQIKTNSVCPADMVLVDGMYCTELTQTCKRYMKEDVDKKGMPIKYARCAEFFPSKCIGKKVHKRFCIERFEHTAKGEALPMVNITFEQAKQICEADGKRICKETEGEFAMEGEEMFAYSVSNIRPSGVCNFDNTHLGKIGNLIDLRKSEAELADCKSPFGVISGPGNVDEFYERDRTPGKYFNSLKFGWWGCLRNRVRPATVEHSDSAYSASTVGTRCCKDIQ